MGPVIVVIPVYDEQINAAQLCSLRQCFKILKLHPFALVCPENFNAHYYEKEAEAYGLNLQVEKFEVKYFKGIDGYNTLLLSTYIFERFKDYTYMLIHQLDAYVFKDDLLYWCEKKLDYIGAVWFNETMTGLSNEIEGVGNGGFSLRHVRHSLKLIKKLCTLRKLCAFWYKSRLQSFIRFYKILKFTKFIWGIRDLEKIQSALYYDNSNEDEYWTLILGQVFDNFRIAVKSEAIQFSFEMNASYLYEKNNNQLPFGCHGWEKYEPQFWCQFIDFHNA